MMEQFYFILSSKDSQALFSTNTPNDFTVSLPQSIDLHGTWHIAVTEVSLETDDPSFPGILLCCNLCEESILGQERQPVLRHLTFLKRRTSWEFSNLQYLRVNQSQVNSLRIYVKARDKPVILTSLLCTLHLKRVA